MIYLFTLCLVPAWVQHTHDPERKSAVKRTDRGSLRVGRGFLCLHNTKGLAHKIKTHHYYDYFTFN